jgi:tetratricopeptide (TPR) repeat protein
MNTVVEECLRRAEGLIYRGERDKALALLVIALDNAPGDPEVAHRVDELRVRATAEETEVGDLGAEAPVRQEPVPATPIAEPRASTVASSARRGRRAMAVAAWVLVLGAGGLTGLVVRQPDALDNLLAYQQLSHPYDDAAALLEAGQPRDALAQAQRVTRDDPRYSWAVLLSAQAHQVLGSTEAAGASLSRLLALPGAEWLPILEAGRLLKEIGNPAAEAAYDVAFERGAPAEYWIEIATAYVEFGRRESALSLLRRVGRAHPFDADSAAALLRGMDERLD